MIPALLAAPMVQGVVGGVVGSVMNAFAPHTPTAPAPVDYASFNTTLNRTTPAATSSGILRSGDLQQMSSTEAQSFAQSLNGRHVDITDESGRTYSGTVNGIQQSGHSFALNVGGHLVSLSQTKQITWSASAI